MLKVTRCEFVHNLPCEQVSGRLTELEAENAKLRELLAELYEEQCDECNRWKYRDRMCELEVEVDE